MSPHAENERAAANGGAITEKSLVNGERPHSIFLSHLTSYPVVSDGIKTFKTNPYGAKSLSLATQVYTTADANLIKPLTPYLKGPYSYVAPYLAQADDLGDNGLKKFESTFPIVKSPTNDIKSAAFRPFEYPLGLAQDGRSYVLKTWDEEYKKTAGPDGSIVKKGKAFISTELHVASDVLAYFRSFLIARKDDGKARFGQAKKTFDEKLGQAKEKFDQEKKSYSEAVQES